ncbi:hypothetical protein [Helicobacter fennelliae]|uniref:hypothetical protein n=1 Tax=Helicobacter fennelliae TaxID=215 RepID=UPI000E01631E|nr:hypothetical protein [Helicobacter fennelliae]STQ84157.1 Uncharacterised protein [Helicobacter fennelliae]
MIVATNNKPSLDDFASLMKNADILLNEKAKSNSNIKQYDWGDLEKFVCKSLEICAKNTAFENKITLLSGKHFPDIVAEKYYGIEVKSTKGDHWTTTGGSILEGSRIQSVERIFLTFGKLGGKCAEFLSRPYEDCLYEIATTHYPRYKIDMRLQKGNSIFDKMGIAYDELRNDKDPILKISQYYKKQLKEGEKLWWASSTESEATSPSILRFWNNLSSEKKKDLMLKGLILFPEVIVGQYNNFSMRLVTQEGIICPNVRDLFSAGGKFNGLPAVYKRIYDNRNQIKAILSQIDLQTLFDYWGRNYFCDSPDDKLSLWIDMIGQYDSHPHIKEILNNWF